MSDEPMDDENYVVDPKYIINFEVLPSFTDLANFLKVLEERLRLIS